MATLYPTSRQTFPPQEEAEKNTLRDTVVVLEDQAGYAGWIPDYTTWAFSSADGPTGVITIPSDGTLKYSPGMRIKLTQTTVKYFIVTAVAATTLTVYGGTDYTLANAAITSPFFSYHKLPFGFNGSPAKWTEEKNDTGDRVQAAPTTGTWYNLGTTNAQLSIPIGVWNLMYNVAVYSTRVGTTAQNIFVTLSTANNSASDADLTSFAEVDGANSTVVVGATLTRSKTLTVASKTLYYLNAKAGFNSDNIYFFAASTGVNTIIRAVCGYL